MKKALAIILTLVMLISTSFCVPILTGSATGDETYFSFTDGSWGITKNAGGTATPNETAKTVSFTGAQYQSAYTKISNLTPDTLYEISIDVDVTLNSQVWVLPGDETLTFNDSIPLNATCITTINGTKFNAQFEAKETSYHLIFRNIAGTLSYTLSNFECKVVPKLSDEETAGNAIANSTWRLSEGGADYLRTTTGWGSFNGSNGTVTITDPNSCRSTMAQITGLTVGNTYSVSFTASGITAAYVVLDYDSAYFNTDQIVTAKAGKDTDVIKGSKEASVFTVEFTATKDNAYLIVKNSAGTVTLSGFTLNNVSANQITGEKIANGTWQLSEGGADYLRTTAGWGSFNGSDGKVTITDPNSCRSTMTHIAGLTAGKAYSISFTASGITAAYVVLDYDSAYFNVDQIVTAKAGKDSDVVKGSNNASVFTVTFTATKEDIYLIVKNSAGTVTLSDFNIGEPTESDEPDKPIGSDIVNGTWWSTRNATYTVSGNTITWTTDPSYHSVYTELKGLKPNTKYEVSFGYNVEANIIEVIWLYKGSKSGMTLNSANDRPAEYTSCEVSKKSGQITASFTTGAEESTYCFGIKVGNANGLILSDMTFGEWTAKEVIAGDIANGEWTLGEGGSSTTDLVGTNGWGKFIGVDGKVTITDPNSCRTSFTKVKGFVPGKEYELIFSATGITGAKVVLADGSAYIDGVYQSLLVVSGQEENVVSATVEGGRYLVRFTAKNDYIYLTVKNNAGTVTLSDFIFDPISISAAAKWGGMVTVSPSDVVAPNTEVSFTATPNIGNYFVGWYDGETLVSTEKVYSVTAQNDISLNAVFDGKNISSDDIFAQRGYDGTFENGTIPGWYATHYNAADASYVSFCNYTVSSNHAYEGKNSLRLQAYHRCSILPLKDLNKNTNYRLSFYVLYEDNGVTNDQTGRITSNAIMDSRSIHLANAEEIYSNVGLRYVKANSGWYRVDMYFNTGDSTDLNYELYYGSEDYATGCAYIDNMTLSEYHGSEDVLNADFSADIDNNGATQPDNWMSDVDAAADDNNAVLKLDNEQTAYQIINTTVDGLYTVSFKAKGKVRAAAVDLAKTNANIKNLLSSASYVDTNNASWKEYSFDFYTNNHQGVKLMFEGLQNGAMVDDIKLTKAEVSADGIIENIDFESERFNLSDVSNESFSLYKKTSDKDSNVLSGETSLKFSPSGDEKKDRFIENFMSYQTLNGVSYTVTFNYKSTGSGDIYLTPDIYEKYGVEQGYTYSLGKGWKKTEFHFTAFEAVTLKAVMAAIIDVTKGDSTVGDVYFDDITFKVRLPLIYAYDLENTYCDAIFNAIDYTGFEFFKNDGNMGELSKGFDVVKSKSAQSGSNIMTVTAGNKQIFAFNTLPNKIYEFGVSLKGDKKTVGSVSVTVDAAGKYHYSDTNNVIRSKVTAPTNSEWKREAFSFVSNSSGITYVVIECSGGVMEIDDMMLFESTRASLEDNNDYTIYTDYDFKNPAVKIYNGGFTDEESDNTEENTQDQNGDTQGNTNEDSLNDTADQEYTEDGNPSTGSSTIIPVIILFITLLLACVVLLKTKKGGEQA